MSMWPFSAAGDGGASAGRGRGPRLALNGLGRTGKYALQALIEDGFDGEIVLINDKIGDPGLYAHLFEFDSVHGRGARRSRRTRKA